MFIRNTSTLAHLPSENSQISFQAMDQDLSSFAQHAEVFLLLARRTSIFVRCQSICTKFKCKGRRPRRLNWPLATGGDGGCPPSEEIMPIKDKKRPTKGIKDCRIHGAKCKHDLQVAFEHRFKVYHILIKH